VSSVADNILSFKILASVDVKYLLVVDVHNVLSVVLEYVPPDGVSTLHDQVLASAVTLDSNRGVAASALDGSSGLVEIP